MSSLTFFLLIMQSITLIAACIGVRFAYKAGYLQGGVDAAQEILEQCNARIREHIKATRGWN